ncbi:hypothetical protein FLJC2902T_29960 [Flavobacterium limnosediminis JC2902]|uniref:Uncharacterized protein n=1 Tax=Flavobacterium limnosediminis JC2902 TaxID=1341181 RepID=V6SGV5_9FLAO|nr:hypothetical protein FLJC2902T_29960 [Flavobacterium limnosediminis JC2902]
MQLFNPKQRNEIYPMKNYTDKKPENPHHIGNSQPLPYHLKKALFLSVIYG